MPLPRLHLFELEDLSWFPSTVRDLATDYLQFMQTRFNLPETLLPILVEIIEKARPLQIVDLCSGGGGPVVALSRALAKTGVSLPFTLTDKYPNTNALRPNSGQLVYFADSVDATRVPQTLTGLRTMFNAFHHFPPKSAHAILASAVEARQPIAIFEFSDRTPSGMLPYLFTPIFVAIATAFIRPVRWPRILWTYLLPLVPLTCWWDGLISQWRAYTVEELLTLTSDLNDYTWTASRIPVAGGLGRLTYLYGIPRPVEVETYGG